jgi:hypothetical protein
MEGIVNAVNQGNAAIQQTLVRNLGQKNVPFTPLFLAVKLTDIGLVTVYYFVFGITAAKLFDIVYGQFRPENYEKVSSFRLFLEIVLHLFLIGVVSYLLRNIVSAIPFPLEGVAGFRHERLKELEGGHVLAIVMVLFQKNLIDKIKYFANRVLGIRSPAGGEA